MILLILSDLFQKQENMSENEKAGCTLEIFAKIYLVRELLKIYKQLLRIKKKKTPFKKQKDLNRHLTNKDNRW